MNCAIVYFSRTKVSESVARKLAAETGGDLFPLTSTLYPPGPIGYLRGLWRVYRAVDDPIEAADWNLDRYGILIVGGPVWASHVPPPLRAFLGHYGREGRQIAFFTTCGGKGGRVALQEMEELCGKVPLAKLELDRNDFLDGFWEFKTSDFLARIRSRLRSSFERAG